METVEILKMLLDDMLGTRMIEGRSFDFSDEYIEIPRNYLNERLRVKRPFNRLTISRCCIIMEHFLSIEGKHSIYTDTYVDGKINSIILNLEEKLNIDFSEYKIIIPEDKRQYEKRLAFYDLFKVIMESCENRESVPLDELRQWYLNYNIQENKYSKAIWRCPKPVSYFYGRENELSLISHRLEEKNTIVITGISGIGKTELVKRYVEINRDKYENVLFLTYNESIKETLVEYFYGKEKSISEDIDKIFPNVIEQLSKWGERSVLIIDNMNVLPEMEEHYELIRSYKFKTIFTTTMEYDGAYKLRAFNMYDGALSIFRVLCPRYVVASEEDCAVIEEMINDFGCHTYLITLLARLLQSSIILPQELLKEMKAFNLEKIDYKVISDKDNNTVNEILSEHVNRLMNIMIKQVKFGVNSDVIRYLVFVPQEGISLQLFTALCGKNSGNDINVFRRLGIIEISNQQVISIHPLMKLALKKQYLCNYSSCRYYIMSVSANINSQLTNDDLISLYKTMILLGNEVKCLEQQDKLVWVDEIWQWYTIMISEGKAKYAQNLYNVICNYERENKNDHVMHTIWCLACFENKVNNGELENIDKYTNELLNMFSFFMREADREQIVKKMIIPYVSHFYYVNGKYYQLIAAYKEALENYKKAESFLDDDYSGKNYYKLVEIKYKIARCSQMVGDMKGAVEELTECKKMLDEHDGQGGYKIEYDILLGLCYAQLGEKTEYEKCFEEGFNNLDKIGLNETEFGIQCRLDKALGLIYLREFNAAKKILEEVDAWCENNDNENMYMEELYEVKNDMSVVLWELGDIKKSIEYKNNAIRIAAELFGKQSINYINTLYNALKQYYNYKEQVGMNLKYIDELFALINNFSRDIMRELNFDKIDLIFLKYMLLMTMNNYLTNNEVLDLYSELAEYEVGEIQNSSSKKQYMKTYILCSKELWTRGMWDKINELSRQIEIIYKNLSDKELEYLSDEFHMVDFYISLVYQSIGDYKKTNELLVDFVKWCESCGDVRKTYFFEEYLNAMLRLPLNYNQYNEDYKMQYKLMAKTEKLYRDAYTVETLKRDSNYLGLLTILISQATYYATNKEKKEYENIMSVLMTS